MINLIKKIYKHSIPPLFSIAYYKLINLNPELLFDGDDQIFKRIIKTTKLYS